MDIVPLALVGNEKLITAEGICYSAIYSELSNQDVFCAIENYEHLNVYP